MFIIKYKIDEYSQWKDFGEEYGTIEDAIESCGELLYDGFITKIEEIQ